MTNVTDSFNRADNASSLGTADTGQTWTALGTAVFGISSNQAYQSGGGAQALAVVETGESDGTVQVTVAVTGDAGFCFRSTNEGSNWMWNGQTLFSEEGAGNFNSHGAAASADTAGDVIAAVLAGDQITIKRNGTTILGPITSSYNQTVTKHGIRINGDTAVRFDNFSFTGSGGGGGSGPGMHVTLSGI